MLNFRKIYNPSLECPFKVRVYLMYCFENIAILIFLVFGLKLPNHAHFLGILGPYFDTQNNVFVIETIKKHSLV